ncbi:hypothetical protein BGZ99_006077 [Dissophora globulifera]|uniref:Uncharacterized protein n=1 Tax=Dissophora globulifera TaxID=979702 RepID=A0A9P6URN8_9FUNG|nr:hypothetical protein BGZ99_006077 [Dissophora globulifera]
MTKFTSFSFAVLAVVLASILATVSAAPAKSKVPAFTVFQKNNFGGKSKAVSGYGCFNHNLKTVSSVKYGSGPDATTHFYEKANCTGKVSHQMDTSTFASMGGPYKSLSVKVSK